MALATDSRSVTWTYTACWTAVAGLHVVFADDVEIPEAGRRVAQLGQLVSEGGSLGQVGVGHGVFIGRKLNDLDIGVSTVPVLGEQAALGAASPFGVRQPVVDHRLVLGQAGRGYFDD